MSRKKRCCVIDLLSTSPGWEELPWWRDNIWRSSGGKEKRREEGEVEWEQKREIQKVVRKGKWEEGGVGAQWQWAMKETRARHIRGGGKKQNSWRGGWVIQKSRVSMSVQRVKHGSKNVKSRKGKRDSTRTGRQTEGLRGTDKGEKKNSGRCVGSDPYWPHQALAGRCTPRSGRRSRTAAGRRPRSAACRAFPQTASCLLDRKRGRGRKEEEGWKRGENRQMLQLMAPFCWAESSSTPPPNPCPTATPFISSLLCWAYVAAAVVVIVVDLTVVWCATPPWYEGDIFLFSVSYSSLPQWRLIEMMFAAQWVSGTGRKRAGIFCTGRQTVRSSGCLSHWVEREHGTRTW